MLAAGPRRAVGQVWACLPDRSSRVLGMGLGLVTCEVALVVRVRREVQGNGWGRWEALTPNTVQRDKCQGLRLSRILERPPRYVLRGLRRRCVCREVPSRPAGGGGRQTKALVKLRWDWEPGQQGRATFWGAEPGPGVRGHWQGWGAGHKDWYWGGDRSIEGHR